MWLENVPKILLCAKVVSKHKHCFQIRPPERGRGFNQSFPGVCGWEREQPPARSFTLNVIFFLFMWLACLHEPYTHMLIRGAQRFTCGSACLWAHMWGIPWFLPFLFLGFRRNHKAAHEHIHALNTSHTSTVCSWLELEHLQINPYPIYDDPLKLDMIWNEYPSYSLALPPLEGSLL